MTKVLVVGAGAAGLRTAIELLRKNLSVVIRAPQSPLHPSTCSMGAGGLWMPFHCDDPRTFRWSVETLDEIWPLAEDPDCDLVEIVPAIKLTKEHSGPVMEDFSKNQYQPRTGGSTQTTRLPSWTQDPRLEFQHLTVEMLSWQNIVYQLRIPPEQELKEAGYLYAWLFKPPIVNTPKMLEYYLQEIREKGGDVDLQAKPYESIDDMMEDAKQLQCDAIINCTGLGAKKLLDDKDLLGARGILHLYDRKKCERRTPVRESVYGENSKDAVIMCGEGPWGSETLPCYLIPRGDKIVVGGSYLENDEREEISGEENERLLRNATLLGIDTNKSKPVGSWTGFRPYRPLVRLEPDTHHGTNVRLFHCYGFGGSGWTVNVGAAKECASLVLKCLD